MKQILVIVHQSTSTPGLVGQVLRQMGYELDIRLPSAGEELPSHLREHEAAIIFGGPMSANDEHLDFIRAELAWVWMALSADKPLLGICLGAQLLAKVLGAKIAPHPQGRREIGYFPIFPTSAGKLTFQGLDYVYHWHSEGFDLPEGATLLATGETFPHQAFRYGQRVYGLQFHPEMTARIMRHWLVHGAEQLSFPGSQTADQQREKQGFYFKETETWLPIFLATWLGSQE